MLVEQVKRVIEEWVDEEGWSDVPECLLERPAEESHGDYATPFCMQLAKVARQSPRALAERLRDRLLADEALAPLLENVEVAGPGFVNFRLSPKAYAQALSGLLAEGDAIGRGEPRTGSRINLEFVSVNPNGPLHVGHGRYAAYGDALRRLMVFSGEDVYAEFYINDHGRQMDRFGKSIAARYAQAFGIDLPVPEDGYHGDYVSDVAAIIKAEDGDRWVAVLQTVAEAAGDRSSAVGHGDVGLADAGPADAGLDHAGPGDRAAQGAPGDQGSEDAVAVEVDEDEEAAEDGWPTDEAVLEAVAHFRSRGRDLMVEAMRSELADFGVEFDCWFSETILHEEGRLDSVITRLLDAGEAYRDGDAVWLRTSAHGDDKDRVIIRSNLQPTYFAADIAYHENKLERGFDHLINIWGADHHGYVPRMKAAVEMVAGRPGALEVIIGQLVNLLEEGELRQMSTRRGEMVTLKELTDAIGIDAARFFLVMRSHDQTLDLDIGLAKQQSQENPVYYVQYAHARIASILRNTPAELKPEVREEASVLDSAYERDLVKRLAGFAAVVQEAAERRAPHRIAAFAQELAADFHTFYKHCRVIGEEPAVASSRLALCVVAKQAIARCLHLLGVNAPESM